MVDFHGDKYLRAVLVRHEERGWWFIFTNAEVDADKDIEDAHFDTEDAHFIIHYDTCQEAVNSKEFKGE